MNLLTSSLSSPLCYLQAAVGWDYQEKLAQHESQTDAKKGFGGKYGVQKDRQDKVIIGNMLFHVCMIITNVSLRAAGGPQWIFCS